VTSDFWKFANDYLVNLVGALRAEVVRVMSTTNTNHTIHATISLDEAVDVTLSDPREESRELFEAVPSNHRSALAANVWQIGLRALQTAQASANAGRLQEIGGELLDGLRLELTAHVERHGREVDERLRRYFDPESGEVSARLDSIFTDDGQLSRVLKATTGPQGDLATTLEEKLGPLMRTLDPDHSAGIIRTLIDKVESVVATNRAKIDEALDPMIESSAAGRFVTSLRKQLDAAGQTQAKRLEAAAEALDANNEGSLLSRLLRETSESRQQVMAAISPSGEGSLLGPLEATVSRLLESHRREQTARANEEQVKREAFEKEMRETIQRIETQRTLRGKGVEGGRNFEKAVYEFANDRVGGSGQLHVDFTGNTPSPSGAKVGDVVLTFTEESAYAGAKVVIEAKREQNFSTTKALDELDRARNNRDAASGLFVLSQNTASESFPRLARFGHRVLVVWDADDPLTDAWLYAALLLTTALASRMNTETSADEAAELDRTLAYIEGAVKHLAELDKQSQKVLKSAQKMIGAVSLGKSQLEGALHSTRLVLDKVRSDRIDEAAEEKTPISSNELRGAQAQA